MCQMEILRKIRHNQWLSSKEIQQQYVQDISIISISKNVKQMSKFGILKVRRSPNRRCKEYMLRGL